MFQSLLHFMVFFSPLSRNMIKLIHITLISSTFCTLIKIRLFCFTLACATMFLRHMFIIWFEVEAPEALWGSHVKDSLGWTSGEEEETDWRDRVTHRFNWRVCRLNVISVFCCCCEALCWINSGCTANLQAQPTCKSH